MSATTKSRFLHLPATPLSMALIGLLVLMYGPLLWHWVDGWLSKSISIQHEYFSHGLLGLPFAAYLAWTQRPKWHELSDHSHPAGWGLLGLGTILYLSQLPDWMNFSFPLILAGLCLSLKGLPGLKLLAFPLVLVIFATPSQLPYLIEPYILPLQHFIASVAGFLLSQGGMDVTVDQIYLRVNDQMVEVAPHCAGLKILFTSLYVALILIYWTDLRESRFRTGVFLTATVCLSVIGNIIRNALLSYFHGTNNEAAFVWLHESWGGDVYSAIMLLLLVALVRLIEHYVPENLALKVDTASKV
ncbi:MAG: cyanoexosortase B [Leptolyngbya sp. SIO1D8]|nr:cyanoexosortase B [Leptolyngbya sp. SIO1D8]